MAIYVNLNRDSSKDIQLGNPTTVYTDSTTLTTSMTLYDNTGTDTGYVVGNINNNNFDACVILTLDYYNPGGAYTFPENITVNSQTFTNASLPLEVLIPVGIQSTITLTCTDYELYIADSSENTLVSGYGAISYSFTPTTDCTYKLARCIEPS